MNILITGCNGYIGNSLVKNLYKTHTVTGLSRQRSPQNNFLDKQIISDLNDLSIYSDELKSIDTIIHSAARAHVKKRKNIDENRELFEYRETNSIATINLANTASSLGVRRFIFLSSIGVNGDQSDTPFTEQCAENPHDLYAISKQEAEQGLREVAYNTDMEVVIIRPPLVYGPNPPGNFSTLLKWVNKGLPLPLGAIHNKRSFVALDNLVDFISRCADPDLTPAAGNETFLIADNQDVSTTELLQKVASAYEKPSRLIPVPEKLLWFSTKIIGKEKIAAQLLASLQINISKAQRLLNWQPVITMDEQLKKIALATSYDKIT